MRLVIMPLVLCGSASLAALAADGPSGRPPRSHIQPVGEIAAAEQAMPWAGLVTARAPAVLREQFRLERGAGLVVESVAPGSVAERAGLKRHDVIVSIDGQLLLLPEQFVTLLEASDDDAPLECRVLRGGIEKMISLRKEVVVARAVTKNLKPAESSLALVPRKQPASVATITQLPDGSLQERDAKYLVRITGGDEQRLIIKDARGRIVFNGAIDTPEQRSLVPPEVRHRVEGLERLVARQQAVKQANDDGQSKPPQARIGTLDIKPIEIR
jgi:membrane-associated protease RseP (regulator of RpoE activity)